MLAKRPRRKRLSRIAKLQQAQIASMRQAGMRIINTRIDYALIAALEQMERDEDSWSR